jgi:cholinesterase
MLYPAVFDGSHNYTSPFDRGSLFISEFIIACNARYLVKALSTANEYLFSVPPGYHGMDVPYTYFASANDAVSNNTLAQILQRYITYFAKTGNPNGNNAPNFPKYANGMIQNLNLTFINQVGLCYTPFDISATN